MSLEGKIALVTGAARGIGRAIALVLAEEGADVARSPDVTIVSRRFLPRRPGASSSTATGAGFV